jgi:four helix bundle protein
MYSTFEDMPVWQKAMDLAEQVFAITESLPKKEDYGLTSQIRRSALSVSANIAEGFGRHHTKDKLNFYYASRGSLAETKSHLIYGFKVHYFNSSEFTRLARLVENIWEELNKLIASLRPKP